MQSRKKQQGLTFLSWLVLLVMVGVFIMVGIKITPVYLEHYAVVNTLESMKEEPLVSRKPLREIRTMLMRRFDTNSIYDLTKDEVVIKRSGGVTTITVAYEERRHVMGNLSLVMTFEDSIELISN
jgi:hypothetical protein